MADSEGISLEALRVLAERARLNLTQEELESLKPQYDSFARGITELHELKLGAEDLAVVLSNDWNA